MDYILNNWITLVEGVLLGMSVGMLTGLFGAGGGFIITPALNIFMGIPMNIAVGTSSCQVLGASSIAISHHIDRRFMGAKIAFFIGTGIPLGSYVGASVIDKWKNMASITIMNHEVNALNFILMVIFAIFLSLISAWLLFDNFVLSKGKHKDDAEHVGLLSNLQIPPIMKFRTIPSGPFSIPILVILGLIMGFMSGLLGIGGGVIMMPMLFYIVGQETKYATLTSTMLIFISGLFASIFHAINHNINYILVVALIIGAFGGTKFGVKIHKKMTGHSIRKYFAFVVLGAALMTIYKLLKMVYFDYPPT
jgi:uncharacterized protein